MKCTVFMCFYCGFYCRNIYFLVYLTCIQEYKCSILYTWNAMFCKCFHVFLQCFDCKNMYFWYIKHLYKNTHIPHLDMQCTVLSVFSCVFTVFLLQKHVLFVIFHMNTRIHMYHTFYMQSTVFLVFSCVFTVFLLQKHVFLVDFTWIQEYTCTILHTWNALFWKCFHVFLLRIDCSNMYFWYILHEYRNTHEPYFIHEMHCFESVFQVFSLCFYCIKI
jgi:hypothetical protein